MLVAVPEFNDRVSPTFDFCRKVSLWRLDDRGLIRQGEKRCEDLQCRERAAKLVEMEVDVLLCGAIGTEAAEEIGRRGIEIVPGLSGRVLRVVAAYACGMSDRPEFRMPGAPGPAFDGAKTSEEKES